MTKLQARDLSVSLRGAPVLQRVDCTCEGGQVVGVVGPNGAGKSTFLRALAGLLPYAGSIALDGGELRGIGPIQLAKRRAYLPQGGDVHWPLTAEAIVALGRFAHGDAGNDAGRAAVMRAMKAADVAALADRPYPELSGGERARVLLARALAAEAEIVLADEPAAQLDPRHAWEALSVLRSAAQKGALVVVALHDLTAASRMCDQVLAMSGGRVRAFGSPSDVLTQALLHEVFGVDAHIGHKDGAPYVVPLKASA